MAPTVGCMSAAPVPSFFSPSGLAAAAILSAEAGPFKVLLVDGNAHFVNSARNFLTGLNGVCVVGHASTVAQALDKAELLRPDLVLLDIAMPDMRGLELVAHLQTRAPVPAIVFLSQSDNTAYRDAARLIGATGFVVKSNLVTDLPPLIERQMALKTRKTAAP